MGGVRHPFTLKRLAAFSWCFHCERVNKTAAWLSNGWECPSCGAYAELWTWGDVRKIVSSYPRLPTVGGLYPLYP